MNYRYLLFMFDAYYPSGGMCDCVFKTNVFEEIEEQVLLRCHGDGREYVQYDFAMYYDCVEDVTMDYEKSTRKWTILNLDD